MTYIANFQENPHGDITKIPVIDIPSHNIIVGGFPCQPFSISGKQKGFEDTRGTLIYSVFGIVAHHKPKVVFLENVKHLVHHDRGNTLRVILEGFKNLGYATSWKVLNASDFGVPQNRERIIIVATLGDRAFSFDPLQIKKTKPLKDFLESDESLFEYLDPSEYTLIENPKKQVSGLIFAGYRNKTQRKAGIRPDTEHLSRVHKQPNRIYSSDGVHPTIPSQESAGRFWILHEGRVRKLTITECYRIMGFSDEHKKVVQKSELYKQAGNSVCVPMMESLAIEINQQFFS